MKKRIIPFAMAVVLAVSALSTGCGTSDKEVAKANSSSKKSNNTKINAEKRTLKDSSEDEMGLWECDGFTYQYKKELKGKVPDTDSEVTFVVLTNDDSVTFEAAFDSMYSSNNSKRFDESMTQIVEIK